jgi:hypothetical protein
VSAGFPFDRAKFKIPITFIVSDRPDLKQS